MGFNFKFVDNFVNLLSGIGMPGRDKQTGATFTFSQYSTGELEAAYRSDWIARKIVNIPPQDSTREWREWHAEVDDVEQLEATEKALDIQRKLKNALALARLYGGSAIVMGVDQGDPSKELDVETVTKDQLKFIRVLPKHQLGVGPIINDVLSPYAGEPEYFSRMVGQSGDFTSGEFRIHPSRVIIFRGEALPSAGTIGSSDIWGDSVLQSMMDAIIDTTSVVRTIATMVNEAKIDVIKIPDLTAALSNEDSSKRLITRFTHANTYKSIINSILLDKDEEWQRIASDFTTLPEIMRMFFLNVSGAADIPVTRMLGQSPAGLSATGESDIRNYYDRIASDQANELTPLLSRLDEVLIRSALGSRDPSTYYEWRSLWQMTESEQAEIWKKKADIFKVDADVGLMDLEALRIGRQNQLIEDGVYPGLESALELQEMLGEESMESPEDQPDPAEPQLALPIAPGDPETSQIETPDSVTDSEPKTLYVHRDVQNIKDIKAWAKKNGFKSISKNLHVTVVYSKTPVDWMKMGNAWEATLEIHDGGPRQIDQFGVNGAVVLLFASNELKYRHGQMRNQGASSDYDDYQPHITITYKADGLDLGMVEPYRGRIVLGPEIFEEISSEKLEPGWKPDFDELPL